MVCTFLGVRHDLSRFSEDLVVSAVVPAESVQRTGAAISSVLCANSFSGQVGLSKLLGRLQFTMSWTACRFGRAALQPLHSLALHLRPGAQLEPSVRESLIFLRDLLIDESGRSRHRPHRFRLGNNVGATLKPVLVWSDAMWEPGAPTPDGIGF
eukprot:scaffold53504_cov30-Tisochrysis_lutea.AAC.1